ncbi:KDEL motif-containing protein 1 [Orchesella cincta]|uniref:KDEL motif-containing protein 1 n=1 Tax=Orchesella cincta TaxID=48709 RepID=A0A1D2M544_ORCCI|nr:KDEL motif-containing protein 1 [Orchesella cincta]
MQSITFALIVALINGFVQSQLLPRDEGSMEEDRVLGVEPKNSTIWGPGLAPHVIVLPARYFFVQLVGPGGQKSNTSQQVRDALKVRIDCNGDRQSCLVGFRITLSRSKRKHVGKSPYKIQGPVHPDRVIAQVMNCRRGFKEQNAQFHMHKSTKI